MATAKKKYKDEVATEDCCIPDLTDEEKEERSRSMTESLMSPDPDRHKQVVKQIYSTSFEQRADILSHFSGITEDARCHSLPVIENSDDDDNDDDELCYPYIEKLNPVLTASRKSTVAVIRSLLYSVDDKIRFRLLQKKNSVKSTPLHEAVCQNTADCVKVILDSVSVEERAELLQMQDEMHWTPLHLAAHSNTADCIKLILDSVSVEERAKLLRMGQLGWWTPLHYAARYNTADCVKVILDSEDDKTRLNELLVMTTGCDFTPLRLAAVNFKHPETLRYLLSVIYLRLPKQTADELILSGNADGYTLLHHAAMWSCVEHTEVIVNSVDREILFKLASTRNDDGNTPAKMTNSVEIKQMIDAACRPMKSSFYSESPPTVLVFYSTIDREEAEEERNSFCQLFSKNHIHPRVHRDATAEQVETEIRWATQNESLSGLIVAVLSHGLKGQVKLKDKIVEISSLVSIMSAPGLLDKPKVLLIQACQTERAAGNLPAAAGAEGSQNKPTDATPGLTNRLESLSIGAEAVGALARGVETTPQRLTSAKAVRGSAVGGAAKEFSLTEKNFLVLMAAVRGGPAYRNVLVPYLVEHMRRLGDEDDLYDAFLKASRRVQEENPDQTPIFMSTMTRKFCLGKFFLK